MRDIDRGRSQIKLKSLFFLPRIDETKTFPWLNMVELVEWVVVALIVGDHNQTFPVLGEANREAVAAAKRFDVVSLMRGFRASRRDKLQDLTAKL